MRLQAGTFLAMLVRRLARARGGIQHPGTDLFDHKENVMKKNVLALQKLTSSTRPDGGGSGGGSNLSLIASCDNSTISLLTCH
jgi:hypothetical protein